MKKAQNYRSFATGAVTFSAATAMTSVAALAACGGAPTLVALSGLIGPPSITATESSTDQALELIRKRREEASGACPSGFTRSGGNCVPIGAASAPAPQAIAAAPPAATPAPVAVTTTTTTGPAPAAAPAAKRPAAPRPAAASAPQQVAMAAPPSAPVTRSGGSIKDGPYDVPMAGVVRAHGVWVEGYYDYEKHSNINPGREANPTRRTVSGGILSGVDISQYSVGGSVSGWQLGFFGGYNSTGVRFTDTIGDKLQDNGTLERTRTTNSRQDIEGGFGGIYGSVVSGAFSADLAFKIDAFDLNQRVTETLVNCANVPVTTFNQTSMTNYVLASNFNYRFNLSRSHYIEPTVGLRYTHTDFGGNAGSFGLRDGDAFRVQGGLRLGTRFTTPDGWIWNTSLTGLLYSDVSISGFVVPSASPLQPTIPLVDEGKLRVMGVLENRVEVGYGYTLYGDVEVRGGDDVFGFASRLGIRKQW